MSAVPHVSIVIPIYNSESYIEYALDSVMTQSGVDIEVIVVDDGSTDNSRNIVRSYPFVKLIEQANQGACRARNLGLENSTGKFVKFLDADDCLAPGSIARQVEFMNQADETTVVYGDLRYFNQDDNNSRINIVPLEESEDQVVQLLRSNIQTSAPLHRRMSLLAVGGFDERLKRAQEYNLHLRLAIAGYKFKRLPGIVSYIREHDSPQRITNQQRDFSFDENEKLRALNYLDLLRGHYGAVIPTEIRRHFVSNGAERALVQLRYGEIKRALGAIRYAMQYDPKASDLLVGSGTALRNIVVGKLHNLNILPAQSKSRRGHV